MPALGLDSVLGSTSARCGPGPVNESRGGPGVSPAGSRDELLPDRVGVWQRRQFVAGDLVAQLALAGDRHCHDHEFVGDHRLYRNRVAYWGHANLQLERPGQ